MKGWIWIDDTWIRLQAIRAFTYERKTLYRRAELIIDVGTEPAYRFTGNVAVTAFELLEKAAREDGL